MGAVDHGNTALQGDFGLGKGVELLGVDDVKVTGGQQFRDLAGHCRQRVAGDGDGYAASQGDQSTADGPAGTGRHQVGDTEFAQGVAGLPTMILGAGEGRHQLEMMTRRGQRLDGVEQNQPATVHRGPGSFCRDNENAEGLHYVDLTGNGGSSF